jgi:hypothetical protein
MKLPDNDRLVVEQDRYRIQEAILAELGITPTQKGFKLDSAVISPLMALTGKTVERSHLERTIVSLRDNDTDKRFRRVDADRLLARISKLNPAH